MLGVRTKGVNGTQGQRRGGAGRTGGVVAVILATGDSIGSGVGTSAIEFLACNGYDVSAFIADDT
jgi:hypothetical protein